MVRSFTTEAPQIGCHFIETVFTHELLIVEFQRVEFIVWILIFIGM